MSITQKDWAAKWLPLIFTIATNIAIVAYGYGKLEQRVAPLENHVLNDTTERQLALFVTRAEYTQRIASRDGEMADMKASLTRIENKIDRAYERVTKSE